MIERKFIEKGIRNSQMETYLNSALERADYSHSDIKRTPLNTRIVIYAGRPGVVIGHAGTKINEMTEALKNKFKLDNPQIEVKTIPNQYLDPKVIAKQIASSLERGMKHRQIVNIMIKKIMGSGAIGVEITISGKISGSRARNEKFMDGYLKKCGNTSDVHTLRGFERATLKAGVIGVKVKLMTTMPSVLSIEKRIEEKAIEKKSSEKESAEKQKNDTKKEAKDKDTEKEASPAEEKNRDKSKAIKEKTEPEEPKKAIKKDAEKHTTKEDKKTEDTKKPKPSPKKETQESKDDIKKEPKKEETSQKKETTPEEKEKKTKKKKETKK
ncbi:MAG: 30S ribosomal protein S3 [archaeon]